ncbi:unnamed protein product [Lampetra fluviatilis]
MENVARREIERRPNEKRADQNQHERVHDKQLCRVRRVAGVGPPESLKVKMSGAACGVFGLCTTHMKGAGLARGAAVSDGSADQRLQGLTGASTHRRDVRQPAVRQPRRGEMDATVPSPCRHKSRGKRRLRKAQRRSTMQQQQQQQF